MMRTKVRILKTLAVVVPISLLSASISSYGIQADEAYPEPISPPPHYLLRTLLSEQWYTGVWEGWLKQTNPIEEYSFLMTLIEGPDGTIIGTSAYPEIRCGGELTLLSLTGDSLELFEHITYDDPGPSHCVSGVITLTRRADGGLDYSWRSDEYPSNTCIGTLTRISSGGMDVLSEYIGIWQGTADSYSVLIGLTDGSNGTIVGSVAYPSLQCGGELTLQNRETNSIELLEDLTFGLGSCIDNGAVTLTMEAGCETLSYGWHDTSSSRIGTGTLDRISTAWDGCDGIEATTSVIDGLGFFEPEASEEPIPAPVFARGGEQPTFVAEISVPNGAERVDVEVIDPTGHEVQTVSLTQSDSRWKGSWDWTSANWTMIPDDIPVGEYTARFQIDRTGCCTTITQDEHFYVIFNPTEVAAPDRFMFDDTGIWFAPSWGKDRALTYALHPNDNRIFGKAIELAAGTVSAYQAGQQIMQWVVPYSYWPDYCHGGGLTQDPNRRFVYSTCTGERDVLNLLARPDQLAQCADSANLFVAMLRAIGIPAHPVTADAANEHGRMEWGFDTWVEALLIGPSGEQWYVFHPHEGIGPVTRQVAGMWSLAAKHSNDVIVIATENWASAEVADSQDDLEFGYNECDEPNQNFNYKAAWIDHLCLDYWGEGHWTCPDATLQTPDEGLGRISISLDRERYSIGDTVLSTVTISNPTNALISSNLVVSVTADDPLTMQFPDQILQTFEEGITVGASSSETITKPYNLPLSLSSEYGYYVEAAYADLWTMTTFVLEPFFEWSVTLPGRVEEGAEFTAQLTITNPQVITLENISVTLDLPFDIGTQDPREQRISALEQGTSEMLTWNLTALSRSEISQLVFTITSDNAGGVSIFRGVEIYSPTRIYFPLILRNG